MSVLSGFTTKIKRKEWIFVSLIIFLAVTISSVPYLYGFYTTPKEQVYSGLHNLTPGDIYVYLSFIEQAREGKIIFQNLYTSEEQISLLFQPHWIPFGVMAKIFSWSNYFVFQLARIIFAIIFLLIAYLFLAQFFEEVIKRKIALILLTFASGIGVFTPNKFVPSGNFSVDLWVPEAITFLTILHNPLFLLSLSLILLIFLFFLKSLETFDPSSGRWQKSFKYSIWAGILTLVLGIIHPYDLATILAVLSVYLIAQILLVKKFNQQNGRTYLRKILMVVLGSLPVLIYYLIIFFNFDALSGWAGQNVTMSPAPWWYLTGYGLAVPLAFLGTYFLVKEKKLAAYLFAVTWAVTAFFLIYFPFLQFQRRLSEGFHIPLIILSTVAIFKIKDFLKKTESRTPLKVLIFQVILIFGAIIFFFSTTFYVIYFDIYIYKEKKVFPFYLSQNESETMKWFRDNSQKEEIILAEAWNGNLIPGIAGRKVYLGHLDLTADSQKKVNDINWFFKDNEEESQKINFLKEKSIDYIFYGEREKRLGYFNPYKADYLELVYQMGETSVFKIKK